MENLHNLSPIFGGKGMEYEKSNLLDLATRMRQYQGTFDTSFITTYAHAKWIFDLLFPAVPYKAQYMLSDIADELNVFEPVFEDILKSFGDNKTPLWKKLTLALISESGLNSVSWSQFNWDNIRERKQQGIKPNFVEIARGLTKLENELLWPCLLGHPPISKNKFLSYVIKNQLELDEYKEASTTLNGLLNDNLSYIKILKMSMNDKNFYTYTKQKWYEKHRDLTRRAYRRWTDYDDWDDGVLYYQILPKNGVTKMKCLSYEERIWIELDDENKIVDVIYFNHPDLTLDDRLDKLSNEQDHLIINNLREMSDEEHFQSLLKYDPEHQQGVIRIPNRKKYNPREYGGEILVKSSHLYDVRLNRVRKENGNIIMEVEALDGLDFFTVGEIKTDKLTDKTVIYDAIKRQMIIENQDDCIIPDEICIVVSVSVLTFTKDTLPQMIDGYFMSVQYDLGIQEVIQIVDILS